MLEPRRRNLFDCVSRPTGDVVGGEAARGKRCGRTGPSGARVCTLLCAAERGSAAGKGLALLAPAGGCFCRWKLVWVWDWPPPAAPSRPRPHRGRLGLFFPLPGGAGGSLGVSMTTLCVWEGQMWGLPARAVPGRSFINVTHIMILSAASY